MLATSLWACALLFITGSKALAVERGRNGGPQLLEVRASASSGNFCNVFLQECDRIKSTFKGSTDKSKTTEVCKQKGSSASRLYTIRCRLEYHDYTQEILDSISTDDSTVTVVSTIDATTTHIDTVSVPRTVDSTVATNTVTSTVSSTVTDDTTETLTATATTPVTVTQIVPATSDVTATSFATLTSTVTTTTTTTSTSISTVYSLAPATSPLRKRDTIVSSSPLCQSFEESCTSVCSSSGASPSTIVCRDPVSETASLACICSNGKTETKHAAYAAVQGKSETMTTTTTTAEIDATSTVSQTVGTTVALTATQTATTTVTGTVHVTETADNTVTVPSTTSIPQTTIVATSAVATNTVTATTTSTSTVTVTASTTTTTTVALAPTGTILVSDASSGASLGALNFANNQLTISKTAGAATDFSAVKDSGTDGLYGLSLASNQNSIMTISTSYHNNILAEYVNNYGYYASSAPGACASASNTAGPAAGSGGPYDNCEVYVFGLSATSTTPSFGMTFNWFNPSKTAPSTFPFYLDQKNQYLWQTGDASIFASKNPDNILQAVTLTFQPNM